jgi:hypothetical protein
MIGAFRLNFILKPMPRIHASVAALAAALSCSAAPAYADTDPSRIVPRSEQRSETPKARLSGDALRRFLADRRIYLSVPLGGELPLFYRSDGHLDGSGEAAGLGRFLAPSDSGRWWIDGERICQKWQSWYDGRTFCFTLDLLGGDRVAWNRDDGEKGVARVGR